VSTGIAGAALGGRRTWASRRLRHMTHFTHDLSIGHWLIVLVIVLLAFGARKLRGLGEKKDA
jgi:hypothetical protein